MAAGLLLANEVSSRRAHADLARPRLPRGVPPPGAGARRGDLGPRLPAGRRRPRLGRRGEGDRFPPRRHPGALRAGAGAAARRAETGFRRRWSRARAARGAPPHPLARAECAPDRQPFLPVSLLLVRRSGVERRPRRSPRRLAARDRNGARPPRLSPPPLAGDRRRRRGVRAVRRPSRSPLALAVPGARRRPPPPAGGAAACGGRALFALWAAGPQQLSSSSGAAALRPRRGAAVAATSGRLWGATGGYSPGGSWRCSAAPWFASGRERERALRSDRPFSPGGGGQGAGGAAALPAGGRPPSADARLLLLNTNQAYYCRAPVWPQLHEASQIAFLLAGADTPEAAARRLGELGITHLVVDPVPRGALYPPGLQALAAGAPPAVAMPEIDGGGPWRLYALR